MTEAEIRAINRIIIEETGGSIGVREPGLLASIAQKPQSAFGGEDLYPDIFLKAAVIYEAIVNYHVFVDGNKRTGFATMVRFLDTNSYSIKLTDKEIEEFTISIALKKQDLADIAEWIKRHTRKAKTN
ncbi:MAG: type II toxin-antitoxin system death-on-curing family toxin [Candidatus Saccharimonadales bacterium]